MKRPDENKETKVEPKSESKPQQKQVKPVLAGYTPPYRVKEKKDSEPKPEEPEKPRKVYTLEFCFSMRK